MKNIEIKYQIEDREEIYQHLLLIPEVKKIWIRNQIDTYFNITAGRLKLRIETGGSSQLIYYNRTNTNEARPSLYEIYETNNPANLLKILKNLLTINSVVKKNRILLQYKNVRIHLDRVKDLEDFLELESVVNKKTNEEIAMIHLKEIQDCLSNFNIIPEPSSYIDLIKK
jgi:predicted adenylyl cyclase CyaB